MLKTADTLRRPVLDLQIERLSIGGTRILGQIDLQVLPAQTVALLGPSGVGKTSVLRIIAGLETRHAGRCDVRGRVGLVFQEPTLLPWRTVLDNLCIPTGITVQTALQALEDVGLAEREGDFPQQLSLGQQRRLSLARAFAIQPDLLLMDEPFVSLDADLVEEMMALFQRLQHRHGVATILVTHVAAEAKHLSDRIITLSGNPAQITDDLANTAAL
ncbi:ABC transporter ATP-binding protein [Phaeobacter inhibens]|uniref:ABC transporter ATP-binding protein n=1 Tax=Phaeobacter inhibens TaxID=221822 RepID=UPI002758FEA2|nr:ATP-binding cassette domain-containing protein [Phaeobacter inhibens]GLO72827.1 ABC transporter ATP-binding protein [Phaeobacter inhibens]